MTTSFPPFLNRSDPRLNLTLQNSVRNVFVTQTEDIRDNKEDNVNYIPVVTESPGSVLEAGVHTLQKTLVLKKQAELGAVDQLLSHKRQEFQISLEALAQRRSELEIKHQQTKDRSRRFEKFVAENGVKRHQAQKRYEATQNQNLLKQTEIEDLSKQLRQLSIRKQVLKKRMAKYKIYEDYLMKSLDYLPSIYLDSGSDASVMPIIWRHETLSITQNELLQRLGRLEEEVEESQRKLQNLKQEHSIKKLVAIKELSEVQRELESLKEKNKQMEVNLQTKQGLSREKVEEVGTLLVAVNNLAEQCYQEAYGPLEEMDTLTKMDMVKDYILDKADTAKRARRLMESGSAMTSRAALTDRRERGSMKTIGSKAQLKSSSKISKKS